MTEIQHQQTLIKWSQQPSIREKWPELRLLHHIGNERHCSPAMGEQLKKAGIRRGVPDLHLPVARGQYHSLYIEMKTETGKTSPEQDWWIEELNNQGNFATASHGWDCARRTIEWYLNLKN